MLRQETYFKFGWFAMQSQWLRSHAGTRMTGSYRRYDPEKLKPANAVTFSEFSKVKKKIGDLHNHSKLGFTRGTPD